MVTSLSHRGPDGTGTFFFDNCALGHTRLSIIDLVCGTQPMLDQSRRVAVTFNGEIYGYRSTKENLASYRYNNLRHRGNPCLYARYGTSMMPHVSGMFSFGIWDDYNKLLFCARDRFGEKPFFYAYGEGESLSLPQK